MTRSSPCVGRGRQVVLSDELADVQRVLPALEALATPAMRDRHWHKVVALLGLDQARPDSSNPHV